MPAISVTRLRLRSLRFLPAFIWYTLAANRQVAKAPGLLSGWVGNESLRSYWTSTAWDSPASMRAYRNSGAHLAAMRKLLHWCDEASFAHWEQDDGAAPEPAAAHAAMAARGTVSKVAFPSDRHAAGTTVDRVLPRAGQRFGRR